MNDSLAVEIFNNSFSLGVNVGGVLLVFLVVGSLIVIATKGLK